MKIHHWIDKYNDKVSFKILEKYNRGLSLGRPIFYSLHYSFFGLYIFRLFLVLCSALSIKKDAYKTSFKVLSSSKSSIYSPDQNSYLFIKTMDFLATLFGYRSFVPSGLLPLLSTNEILTYRIEIATSNTPLVSIVIPTQNHLSYTYNCLKSIQQHISSTHAIQIVVVNNGSDHQTASFFRHNTTGITYVEQPGAEDALNLGASHSSGELICFISQFVQVSDNWMDQLIKTLEDKNIDGAGSKLIFNNGLLRQAGALENLDGSLADYGKFSIPEHPFYNYMRQVDACSHSGLMLRKKSLEKAGAMIVYQPLSSIIDSSPDQGALAAGQNRDRKYQANKTILFIDDVVPAPDQDSGSNRLFKIMRIVRSLGYHVIFMPNDGNKKGGYFDKMVLEGFEVWYRFPNRKGMVKLLTDNLNHIDAVWLCKPANNQNFSFIFESKKDCLWIYDTIDLHFLREKREAILAQNPTMLQAAETTKEIELSIAKKANVTIAITNEEKLLLNNESIENVIVIPNVHEAIESNITTGFTERKGLLFIGSYLHKPNIDAAEWLVKKIMPEVWKANPTISLTLLGSNPTAGILALQSDKVFVPGYVHDVAPYFNTHRIFVAPLRFGAGMKGKIGQSLEYGLPIISTQIGIEGMELKDGYHVLVAETTEEFTAQILRLYQSPELWADIKARSFTALKEYTPESVKQKLENLFEKYNW